MNWAHFGELTEKSNPIIAERLKTPMGIEPRLSVSLIHSRKRVPINQTFGFTLAKINMTDENLIQLKGLLTSEMVSRVTLAEAVNIMHSLALNEVETNVEAMSEEQKEEALKELTKRVAEAAAELEKTEGEIEE